MTASPHSLSLKEYRRETLEGILRDLKINPKSYHLGTWEAKRIVEVKTELENRNKIKR
jgi:hypothetical protein